MILVEMIPLAIITAIGGFCGGGMIYVVIADYMDGQASWGEPIKEPKR